MIPEKNHEPSSLLRAQNIYKLSFPQGLIGFHHLKDMTFSFFSDFKGKPLFLLKALEYANHAWIIIEHCSLDLPPVESDAIFVFYTLKLADNETPQMLEANLMSPIYINWKKGEGAQNIVTSLSSTTLPVGLLADLL